MKQDHQTAHGALAVPEALERPMMFQEFETEVPSGISGTVAEPAIQITEASDPRPDYGQDVLACYVCHPPIHDGSVYVAYLARILQDAFINYERKYLHRVIEAYPELYRLLVDDGVVASPLDISDSDYAVRLANYLYQNDCWQSKYLGSVYNIATMMRLTPGSDENYIGYKFRMSIVNPRMNVFKTFVFKSGLRDYFAKHYKWVVGKEINGAPIAAFPLFNTSVLGVRGVNSVTPSSLRSVTDPNSNANPLEDHDSAELLENVGRTLSTFDHGFRVKYRFTMPFIENGNYMVVQQDNRSYPAQLNIPGDADYLVDGIGQKTKDNVIGHVWTAFKELQRYGMNFFGQFQDRNSVIMRLFGPDGALLKLYTDECDFTSIYDITRNDNCWDYEEFMSYVEAHKHGTYPPAVVHWMPLIPTETDDSKILKAEQLTRYNPFAYRTPREYMKAMEKYPRLAATMKAGVGDNKDTFFLNTIAGQYSGVDGASSLFGPTGGAVSFAVNQNLDLTSSEATMHALSLDDAKKLLTSYGDEIFMFNEAQDSPIRLTQPFIDTADPYQCGLNLLLSKDLKYMSKYMEYLQDPKEWNEADRVNPDNQPINASDVVSIELETFGRQDLELIDYVLDDSQQKIPAHWSNSRYRQTVGTSMVFAGANIAPGLLRAQAQAGAGFGFDDFSSFDNEDETKSPAPHQVFSSLLRELTDDDIYPEFAEAFWFGIASRVLTYQRDGTLPGNMSFLGAMALLSASDNPITGLYEVTLPPTYGFICLPGHVNPLTQWNDVRGVVKLGTEWSLFHLQDDLPAYLRKGYRGIARLISSDPTPFLQKYGNGLRTEAQADRDLYQSLNRYNPYLSRISLPRLDSQPLMVYPIGNKATVSDMRSPKDIFLNLLSKIQLVFLGFGKRFGYFWSDVSFKPSEVEIGSATWDPAIRVALVPRTQVKPKTVKRYAFNPEHKSSRQFYKPELLNSIETTLNLDNDSRKAGVKMNTNTKEIQNGQSKEESTDGKTNSNYEYSKSKPSKRSRRKDPSKSKSRSLSANNNGEDQGSVSKEEGASKGEDPIGTNDPNSKNEGKS